MISCDNEYRIAVPLFLSGFPDKFSDCIIRIFYRTFPTGMRRYINPTFRIRERTVIGRCHNMSEYMFSGMNGLINFAKAK